MELELCLTLFFLAGPLDTALLALLLLALLLAQLDPLLDLFLVQLLALKWALHVR